MVKAFFLVLALASATVADEAYVNELKDDLQAREKLFEDTPPEEIKYWFEYSGPLQKYFYRFSKSRGKADYFEGRDDSGVVSARFVEEPGGTSEFQKYISKTFLDNCFAMGSKHRPNTNDATWKHFYGDNKDRCRVLMTMNTIGMGRGTTMLWETSPPLQNAELPQPWTSEQETAVTHLERNLQEINHLCESGVVAAKLQVGVCEPIPAKWTSWMDSLLPACGGQPYADKDTLDDRPSPVQIVVAASASTADTCHDLKSGFMEKRLQDLVFNAESSAELFSSDEHDVHVAFKWSSLITMRSISSFVQASADVAAAASADINSEGIEGLSSPFLIPSFVRVSYVSEENSKVAKWRMHGDFFHPAAWEICNDSFDTVWIPHSLSGTGGVSNMCDKATGRILESGEKCGQWWVYFKELQMPTSPEVFANEVTPAPVLGGSNFVWMVTDRQRREMITILQCRQDENKECPELPQAVIPLGDLESFLVNFTPNTALGRVHVKGRRPGYSNEKQREKDRQRVKERGQLNDQDDIEKALFDYTIYPAALFHKDATIKSARGRDTVMSGNTDEVGPQAIKSSYYDVTITKPRQPVLGWCQNIARRGLCTLYAEHFRSGPDDRCAEACGLRRDWTKVE